MGTYTPSRCTGYRRRIGTADKLPTGQPSIVHWAPDGVLMTSMMTSLQTEDSLWATVFVPHASTVILTTSPKLNESALSYSAQASHNTSTSVTFQVPAGVSHLKAPLNVGGGMRASVFRDGQTVLDFTPNGYIFNPNPKTYNFNAFVAASP